MYCGYKSMFGCNNLKTMTPELMRRIQSCMFNKKNKDEIIPMEPVDINNKDITKDTEKPRGIVIEEIGEIKDDIITSSKPNENIYTLKEKLLREMSSETQKIEGVCNDNTNTTRESEIREINSVATMESTSRNESKLDVSIKTENIISPTQKDSLFWCIFIIHFGYNEYLQVSRNYGIKELEIKQKIIEYLNKNPSVLKQTNYKITKVSVQEILSDFLTSQKDTSILCFIAMISYFKMNIIMVDSTNRFMLEFLSNKDENLPTYVLYKDSYGKYKVNIKPINTETITNMKNTLICLENYTKPLKTASNYKIDDLVDLARKLGFYNENMKYKKNELYEQICEICKWH